MGQEAEKIKNYWMHCERPQVKSEERTFTYQTRLKLDEKSTGLLDSYADLLSRVERSLFAAVAAGSESHALKTPYLIKYGITARQFNSCRTQVEGKIDSIKELREIQITELQDKIKRLEKTIERLAKNIKNSFKAHQKKLRLVKLKSKLQRLNNEKNENRTSLCFGSKKLFRAQFELEKNGFSSHEEWLKKWHEARCDSFFLLGSKDEAGGNQSCTAMLQPDGTLSIRLRLPDSLVKDEKYLTIPNVKFEYGHEKVLAALYSCLERSHLLKSKNSNYKNFGKPLSYRFKRDKKGWRLFVSTPVASSLCITQQGLGSIGVDINADHLAIAETDRYGNLVKSHIIQFKAYGKTADQAEASINDAVATLIDYGVATKKAIVIEKLDFQKKKTELKESKNPKYARMLSSFAYSSIIKSIKSRAWRLGVKIEEVNPAYTSIIGLVKFALRYGLSRHTSAALCIARRHMRVSERVPRHLDKIPDGKGGHVALPVPVRNRVKHVWTSWRQIKRELSVVLAAHFRAKKTRSSSRRKSACCDMETISDLVGEIPTHESLTTLLG
jgi:IS605 OrfB family transposase